MFHDKDNGPWHSAFNLCANSLVAAAKLLDPICPGGMDYVKINVLLFCIIVPVVLLASLGLNALLLLGLL